LDSCENVGITLELFPREGSSNIGIFRTLTEGPSQDTNYSYTLKNRNYSTGTPKRAAVTAEVAAASGGSSGAVVVATVEAEAYPYLDFVKSLNPAVAPAVKSITQGTMGWWFGSESLRQIKLTRPQHQESDLRAE
jgi:hypothetical protein